jgi:hypothetical protein
MPNLPNNLTKFHHFFYKKTIKNNTTQNTKADRVNIIYEKILKKKEKISIDCQHIFTQKAFFKPTNTWALHFTKETK